MRPSPALQEGGVVGVKREAGTPLGRRALQRGGARPRGDLETQFDQSGSTMSRPSGGRRQGSRKPAQVGIHPSDLVHERRVMRRRRRFSVVKVLPAEGWGSPKTVRASLQRPPSTAAVEPRASVSRNPSGVTTRAWDAGFFRPSLVSVKVTRSLGRKSHPASDLESKPVNPSPSAFVGRGDAPSGSMCRRVPSAVLVIRGRRRPAPQYQLDHARPAYGHERVPRPGNSRG
jgi:hypothetical protein